MHRRTPLKSNNEHHAKLYFRTPLKAQKLATCCIQKQLKESYAIECREIGYEIFNGNLDFKDTDVIR